MPRKYPEADKLYRQKYHKTTKYKMWRKKWYAKWSLRKGVKERLRNNTKRYIEKNRDKVRIRHREYARAYTKRLRLQLIKKYGNQCKCCKEKNINFFTIDHINGDGKEHRKAFHRSTRELYRDLVRKGGVKRFKIQILCFNCNMGRQFRGGINKMCPHKL